MDRRPYWFNGISMSRGDEETFLLNARLRVRWNARLTPSLYARFPTGYVRGFGWILAPRKPVQDSCASLPPVFFVERRNRKHSCVVSEIFYRARHAARHRVSALLARHPICHSTQPCAQHRWLRPCSLRQEGRRSVAILRVGEVAQCAPPGPSTSTSALLRRSLVESEPAWRSCLRPFANAAHVAGRRWLCAVLRPVRHEASALVQ